MVKIYLVGGAVRDQLLGIKSKDLDYTVEASSYEEMRDYIKSRGKIFLESPQYLTIRAHIEGKQPADFVLARKDGTYSNARRPDSVTPGTLFDDLARRDFTVNAIAYDEEKGTYIDPFDGQADLKTMTLKCVGKAEERFTEDALRVLRALRFKITKKFEIHDFTEHAMYSKEIVELLSKNISVDRKRDEMYKCFAFDTVATMKALQYAGDRFIRAIFQGETGPLWLMPTNKDM